MRVLPIVLGITCLLLSGAGSIDLIERLAVPDGELRNKLIRSTINGLRIGLAICGAALLLRRPRLRLLTRAELTLFLFGTIGAFLFFEIGTRIWLSTLSGSRRVLEYSRTEDLRGKKLQWSPHHYLNYIPTPNYQRGKLGHNSLGFRGEEIAVPKPKGAFRIVVLGGSTTYTIAVEDNRETFTAKLQDYLNIGERQETFEVINGGVGGYTSWESVLNLQFRVLDLDPDLIIVYHNINDVHSRLVHPTEYRGDDSGRRKQWQLPRSWLIEQSALIRVLLRKSLIRPFPSLDSVVNRGDTFDQESSSISHEEGLELLRENPPVYFTRNLTNMIAICSEHEIQIVLASWAHSDQFNDYVNLPYYQKGIQEHNEMLRQLAGRKEIPFFDFAREMPKEKEFWSDGRHHNEAGADLKAKLFAGFLKRKPPL